MRVAEQLADRSSAHFDPQKGDIESQLWNFIKTLVEHCEPLPATQGLAQGGSMPKALDVKLAPIFAYMAHRDLLDTVHRALQHCRHVCT